MGLRQASSSMRVACSQPEKLNGGVTVQGAGLDLKLVAVVAADENNVIGVDGDLPWRLPNDLKHFKAVTLGHPILMGRKTYESIGRPLPGRQNLVLTRQPDWRVEGVTVVQTVDAALSAAADASALMLVGGGEVYRLFWPQISVIEFTLVHTRVVGDTRFPAFGEPDWRCVQRDHHAPDARHVHAYSFETWERCGAVLPAGG